MDNNYKILDLYEQLGFDLVPVAKDSKVPIELGWTSKEHKHKSEWEFWLKDGINFGLKCGKVSGVTVIDIDTKEIPEDLKIVLDKIKTMRQITSKGTHLIFKYVSELPKTRIDEYKIDIENDGGQVVLYPSVVNGVKRELEIDDIIEMPEEFKNFLLSKLPVVPLKTLSEEIKEEIINENFNLELISEGSRNTTLLKLGGILRKNLNITQTDFTLNVLNRTCCKPPLTIKELDNVVTSLQKYDTFDERELASKILQYLKIVEDANSRDIKEALDMRGSEGKQRLEKAIKYLVKEGFLFKKSRSYHLIKKAEWKTTFNDEGQKIDFIFPYLDHCAYLRQGDMIIIGAKTGVGKCHGKGTGILMYDGSIKKVENIRINDNVMGIDSTPRKVLNVVSGKEQMYKIIPTKGESFIVNENHILSLKKTGDVNWSMSNGKVTSKRYSKGNVTNISIKDYLTKSDRFKHLYKLYRVPIEFKETLLPIEPYFLGLWLGDGSSASTSITNTDNEVITYLQDYANRLNLKCIKTQSKNRCASYAITKGFNGGNTKKDFCIKHILKNINVINNKHIPQNFKINSRKNRLELLAGLIDSDGYTTSNKTNYEITLINKKLAEDIMFLARSLGFLSFITKRISKIKSINYATEAYRISIVGDCSKIPVKVLRKKVNNRKINKDPLVTGFKIEKLKEDNYFGFLLDGDHLYLIDSFIVNHNTTLAMNMVKRLVSQGKNPHYISLESGARFISNARTLGLKEGDFKWCVHFSPTDIELEENAITFIDWLLPDDYAITDKIYKYFAEQLFKKGGILIVFAQLMQDGNFFAKNMIDLFPALVSKFFYEDEQGESSYFQITKVREAKERIKYNKIPCRYDWKTKELKTVDELSQQNLK
jgi:uncharacterized protein YlzI (FlbEa/FlbD family)